MQTTTTPSSPDEDGDRATVDEILQVVDAMRPKLLRWFFFRTKQLATAKDLVQMVRAKILGVRSDRSKSVEPGSDMDDAGAPDTDKIESTTEDPDDPCKDLTDDADADHDAKDSPDPTYKRPRRGEEGPWIWTIARNVLADHMRKEAKEKVTEEAFFVALKAQLPSPEAVALDTDFGRALAAALNSLDPLSRLVLHYRRLKEFSVADTADFINSSRPDWLSDDQIRKLEAKAQSRVRATMATFGYRIPEDSELEKKNSGGSAGDFIESDIVDIDRLAQILEADVGGSCGPLLLWMKEIPRWHAANRDTRKFSRLELAEIFNEITQMSFGDTFCIYDEVTWMHINIPERAKALAKIQADGLHPRQRVLLNRFLLARLLEPAIIREAWETRNLAKLKSELGLP